MRKAPAARRTTSPRALCLRKRRRKIILPLWNGSARSRSADAAAPQDTRVGQGLLSRRAAALGDDDAKAALKRLDCPYVLKNKRGEAWSNLCF